VKCMYVVRAIKQRCDRTGDDGGAIEKLESDSSEGGGRSCLAVLVLLHRWNWRGA
jgi:hypothetical protein